MSPIGEPHKFGTITPDMVYDYHQRMQEMKNHTNDCNIMCGPNGTCTCSFDNQPNRDIAALLNRKGELERECDHYLDKISDLYAENAELAEDNKALADYPWGHQWTYWFTAMVAGGACMVGLIVGQWMFG